MIVHCLEGNMILNKNHFTAIKSAAERIGDYGKITLVVSDRTVDIITEQRARIQDGYRDDLGLNQKPENRRA